MALEKENATFKAQLPTLLANQGKFVLIHGDTVVDFFATYEDAIKEGYKRFSLDPFLVKQVLEVANIQYITRHITPYSEHRVL